MPIPYLSNQRGCAVWEKFGRYLEKVKRVLAESGGWICVGMTVLIFADVVGRTFFNQPIASVYEISEGLLMVIFVFFALPSAHHINVVVLTSRLPAALKGVADLIRHLCTTVFIGVIGWKCVEMAWISLIQHEMSESYLEFPIFPGRIAVAIGFIILTLSEFMQLVEVIRGRRA